MISGVLQKIKDTGTEDPLNARLMFGVFELRDKMVKSDDERLIFDRLYSPILETLEETQDALKNVLEIIDNHKEKVANASIIKFQGEIIEVSESIDKELSKNFKDFFVKGNRAAFLLIRLFKNYGFNIGFIYKNDKDFMKGVKIFSEKHNNEKYLNFLKMIKSDRESWLSAFIKSRQKVEHEGFSFPHVKYAKMQNGSVVCLFPTVDSIEIPTLLNNMWHNLFEFVEDCVVSLIDFQLEKPWMIIQIPEERRDRSMPLRYKIWAEGLTEFLEKEAKKENAKPRNK